MVEHERRGATADDTSMPRVIPRVSDPAELRARVEAWRSRGLRIAFVPTMGALHAGHLSLVREGRRRADRVVTSIFVNPTQFGPGEDFESYPRDTDGDCRLLAGEGCDLVFLPSVATVYPAGESTVVDVTGPSAGFEGAERPGHFRGVATVVAKLFGLVQPDVAIFGEKDAQQLAVVRRLVRDLCMPIEIVGAPIVREADGLALSSRNVYLDPEERRAARVLSRSLARALEAVRAGERDAETLRRRVRQHLESEPLGSVDYVAVVDGTTFEPLDRLAGRSVIAIAYRLGRTRLLDNLSMSFDDSDRVSASLEIEDDSLPTLSAPVPHSVEPARRAL